MFSTLWNSIVFYCTYIYWFIVHCAHPPVDMWRSFIYGFKWQPVLHALYVDAYNHANFNPDDDYATVVGCSTGVGFESAAGLASTGLTVFAGIRGDQARIDQVVSDLKHRSRQIRFKHFNNKERIAEFNFEPKIIGVEVDVADFNSCIKFAKTLAEKMGKVTTSQNNNNKKQLRVALMNAAVLMTDYSVSPQGFENQSATNALGQFVIAEHLIDLGCFVSSTDKGEKQQNDEVVVRDSRLIFVASSGARFGEPLRGTLANINNNPEHDNGQLLPTHHCQFKMYGDSKALVASYAKLLQRKVLKLQQQELGSSNQNKVRNLSIRALHPGCIASCIVRDSGMPGAHVLAKLQGTVGIWIGAMLTEETASVYPLRLCLGVAGKLKKTSVEGDDNSIETRELFSYTFMFDPNLLRRFLDNEKVLEEVRIRVAKTLAPFFPNKKSILV